jgi:Rrf2 family transcriptional regulator, nitric oxide-sensitive transcriptional repressor
VEVKAGRTGGICLAREPEAINMGQLMRVAEPGFRLVECFEGEKNNCPIAAACSFRGVLSEARDAFLTVLDRYTLQDVLRRSRSDLVQLFLPTPAARAG